MPADDLFSLIQTGQPPFVIAEMANAHEGSIETARAIVEAAAGAGVHAIKFQKFTADELLVPYHPRHGHFKGLEMPDSAWSDLVGLARAKGLYVLADVFGGESARLMRRLDIDGYKIHSSDTIHLELITEVASYGRPVFLSCGGSRQLEILEAVQAIRRAGNEQIVLLHGFQNYPTRLEDTQLNRIRTLAEEFGLPVGYADHVAGDSQWAMLLPVMAVGSGARVIEKHLTLDRSRKGLDYFSSVEPPELARLVELLRDAGKSLGGPYELSSGELHYLQDVKKLMVASHDLPAGTRMEPAMVTYKRVPSAAHPLKYADVAGRTLQVPRKADGPLSLDQFGLKTVALIAVRMHSTRLPRKALLPLAGRPAIEHLIERVKRAKAPSAVVLCTSTHPDDVVLVEVAEKMGIKWFRGSEDDVMLRFLDAASREAADLVVRITGDDLLIDPDFLDRTVAYHLEKNADYTSCSGLPKGMETEVVSVSALKKAHELAEDPSFSEYMTHYLRRPDIFRVSDMPVEERYRRSFRLTLDMEEDYRLLQMLFDHLYRPGKVMTTEEIIEFLDSRQDLAAINAGVRPKSVAINTNLRVGQSCQR
jgi:N,N'-diacetyllegionaminate synthase